MEVVLGMQVAEVVWRRVMRTVSRDEACRVSIVVSECVRDVK